MEYFFCFFFQAEDGIRDLTVTGVQTCALPISTRGRICGSRRTFCTRCRRTGRRGRGEGGRQKAEGIHHRGTEGTEAGREEGRNEAGRRRRSWNDQRVPSAEALG